MDVKRIVPVLRVLGGQLVDAQDPAQTRRVHPAEWAARLETEGADGVLFQDLALDVSPAQGSRSGWIREVAEAVFIPLVLERPFRDEADLAAALEAGADRVILPASRVQEDPLFTAAIRTFGSARVGVAVDAHWSAPANQWRVALADAPEGGAALAWMAELAQRGAGEILLRADPDPDPDQERAQLFQSAARLTLSVLYRSAGEPGQVAEALLHGADGLAFPATSRTSRAWKDLLGAQGLSLRQ